MYSLSLKLVPMVKFLSNSPQILPLQLNGDAGSSHGTVSIPSDFLTLTLLVLSISLLGVPHSDPEA